jgi:feruloyl-CoA synthase
VIDDLLIDRLARNAEQRPQARLLPRFALTNAEAWMQSGGVASWLIAQGFGPGSLSLAIPGGDSPERTMLLLGALRAGALVVEAAGDAALAFIAREGQLATPDGIAFAALARCPVDAAVAERRLHIRGDTPARIMGGICRRHVDFATIDEVVSD